ncbi:hypothetical protein IHE45_07G057500 [Dioscorea alata]|uniref:Uncharacterized protein n=1 Tax=Dioscorea alata TaxID=55571 RepID=A0ACB7VRL0_DIOAL|nr:hypothetical protein IHE45_07G057500 [Dioscorea alata]
MRKNTYKIRTFRCLSPGGTACPRPFQRQCCSVPDHPRRWARPPSTRGRVAGSALGFDAHFDRTRGGRRPSPSSPISSDTSKMRPSPRATLAHPAVPVPRDAPCGRDEGAPRRRPPAVALDGATWFILPVVICLSQRLSHACASMN